MLPTCIQHPPKNSIVVLKQDFIELMQQCGVENKGVIPCAITLGIFEYWTNVKTAAQKQVSAENEIRQQGGLPPIGYNHWIYKSMEQLIEDSLGLLKMHEVRLALDILVEQLQFLERRNNPDYGWDRCYQYRLNAERVNSLLNGEEEEAPILHPQQVHPSPATDASSAGSESILHGQQSNTIDYNIGNNHSLGEGESTQSPPPSQPANPNPASRIVASMAKVLDVPFPKGKGAAEFYGAAKDLIEQCQPDDEHPAPFDAARLCDAILGLKRYDWFKNVNSPYGLIKQARRDYWNPPALREKEAVKPRPKPVNATLAAAQQHQREAFERQQAKLAAQSEEF